MELAEANGRSENRTHLTKSLCLNFVEINRKRIILSHNNFLIASVKASLADLLANDTLKDFLKMTCVSSANTNTNTKIVVTEGRNIYHLSTKNYQCKIHESIYDRRLSVQAVILKKGLSS